MKHPQNRRERRHHRLRIIAHRRSIRINAGSHRWPEQIWAQYSKWNGNCGSMRCHSEKYFSPKRRRREQLKRAGADQIHDDKPCC